MSIKTIDPDTIDQRTVYQYLSSAVAPRPICFASTIDQKGQVNLSPYSFFNLFGSNPPMVVFSPVRSGRDNSTKNTLDNVLEVPEVTINIVNYPIVEQMSLASTAYDKGVNEFVKAGFTQIESTKVKPPRVGEAPISFECVVDQVLPLGDGPGAGNLVIARVVLIHVQEQYLDEEGMLDTTKLDLVARMGGSYYSRVIPESLFEIPKPVRGKGVGIDQLPPPIRNSNILTGNNLGRLGNVKQLPTEEAINEMANHSLVKVILDKNLFPTAQKEALERLAKSWIEAGRTEEGLALLYYGLASN
ncbi:MAG: flavin reductase family protein [Saprospiraceae bacterium]